MLEWGQLFVHWWQFPQQPQLGELRHRFSKNVKPLDALSASNGQVEYYDDVNKRWSFQNVPPQEYVPNSGLCGRHSFSYDHGCDYDNATGFACFSLPNTLA